MEKWSAQLEELRINIFLDTNILCYLIDNTYPALTGFVKRLSSMPIIQLYSSEYVLTELIEVRKKEDYFQTVMKQAKKDKRYINVSSFIKNNKKYDIPHYSYDGDLADSVVAKVNKDTNKVIKEYGISFDSKFNKDLLAPMKGVCLSSKISREDSLVLVSSLFRGEKAIFPGRVILLTNDELFEKWSDQAKQDISHVLIENGLTMPYIEHISKLGKANPNDKKKWDLIQLLFMGDLKMRLLTMDVF